MTRVLIFSLAYYPYVGGAEIAIKEITDRIQDIEFEMITLRFAGEPRHEQIGRVLVHRVGFGGRYISKILYVPLAALAARRLIQQKKCIAIWAMMSYMVFPVVLLRASGIRLPYVLTLQEGDPFERVFERWYIRFVSPLLLYGFMRASVVQVISNFLGEWARRRGFAGPLEVIPNGVDTSRFVGAPVAHPGVVLITSSRLVRKNAVDDCVRALALLPQHITLTVLGSGPDATALAQLARAVGVASRVEFLGYIEHEQLPRYLHAADIFVRPSRSEGMGNSFIEAMAAGLPVIGTQEGGITDFLFDAKRNPDKQTTGWAVDVDNPAQIAAAVEEILRDTTQTARVVQNAREMVLRAYDWDMLAAHMRERVFGRVRKN